MTIKVTNPPQQTRKCIRNDVWQDSVFLVTGGASNDYGRATVETLLKEGARVIICDLPDEDLHIYGDDKAIFLPIDVLAKLYCKRVILVNLRFQASQEKDTLTLIAVIQEKYGKLDGVVNCIDRYKTTPIYNPHNPLQLKDYADVIYVSFAYLHHGL